MLKLALDSSVTRTQVSSFAADQGLAFHDKIEPSQSNPLEIIWIAPDGATEFHHVEDDFIGQHYLAFVGPGADALLNKARSALSTIALDDAVARARRSGDRDEGLAAVSALAVLAPPQLDLEVFEAFKSLLSSPSSAVRQKAVIATGYPAWPQLRPLLEVVKNDDPEDFVRWRAEVALQAFDDFGIKG